MCTFYDLPIRLGQFTCHIGRCNRCGTWIGRVQAGLSEAVFAYKRGRLDGRDTRERRDAQDTKWWWKWRWRGSWWDTDVESRESRQASLNRWADHSFIKPLRALQELSGFPTLNVTYKILLVSLAIAAVLKEQWAECDSSSTTMLDDWFSSLMILASEKDILENIPTERIIDFRLFLSSATETVNHVIVNCVAIVDILGLLNGDLHYRLAFRPASLVKRLIYVYISCISEFHWAGT